MIKRRLRTPESEVPMKKARRMKRISLALAAWAFLCCAPASAHVSSEAENDTQPAEILEPAPAPEIVYVSVPEGTAQPFSIAGNGQVLDDIADGSKEFYTITTANNNTFFIVVDKARSSENVYMLARVDEADIAEFIEGYIAPTPTPSPVVQVRLPTPVPTPQIITVEPEAPEKTAPSYAVIGAAAAIALGGFYYFKVYKPKHAGDGDENEGMEYDDSDEERDE